MARIQMTIEIMSENEFDFIQPQLDTAGESRHVVT